MSFLLKAIDEAHRLPKSDPFRRVLIEYIERKVRELEQEQ